VAAAFAGAGSGRGRLGAERLALGSILVLVWRGAIGGAVGFTSSTSMGGALAALAMTWLATLAAELLLWLGAL